MARSKNTAKGAQALFGAAFTYAFTGVLIRSVGSMWGDKAQVAARYTLVFLFLVIYGHFRKTKARVPRDKLAYAVALGLSFALTVLFFTFAIQRTTLANSLFTHYAANMVVSFLLGTFLLHEKVSATKLIAIVFALGGLALYSHALLIGNLGIVFGVLAGVFGGISNVLFKLLSGLDRNAVLRIEYGVGMVFTILLTLVSRDQIIRVASWHGAVLTIIFALVLITGGNLLLYGYQHFDVNIGTVITSTELVFGALLGLVLYGEVPAPHELAGGILIFAASVLSGTDPDMGKLLGKLRLGRPGNQHS